MENGALLAAQAPMEAPDSDSAAQSTAALAAQLFAQKTEAELLYLAQNQELHVTDLCNRLGQSQPAVSHHLALLRVSGLIESRREGKMVLYSLTDSGKTLLGSLRSEPSGVVAS